MNHRPRVTVHPEGGWVATCPEGDWSRRAHTWAMAMYVALGHVERTRMEDIAMGVPV